MHCGVASHIFALDTRWMSVVSFTSQPRCTQERAPGTVEHEPGWFPESVWTLVGREIFPGLEGQHNW